MSTTTITADLADLKEAARDLVHVARAFNPDHSSKTYRHLVIAALRNLHAYAPSQGRMRNIFAAVDEVLEEEGLL
jgi:hypothetical protein